MAATPKLLSFLLISIVLLLWNSLSVEAAITGRSELVPQDPQLCECLGAELSLNCTIVGNGTTVWRGTSFNCPDRADEITLRHANFINSSETCNMGSIVGRALTVAGNCYTSQLTVTTTADLNNKTISCSHISTSGLNVIGNKQLIVISGSNDLTPTNVRLSDVQQEMLTFTWLPVLSSCTSVQYTTSGCGTCVGTGTSAMCSSLPLSTVASVCNFSVYGEACGFSGTPSNPVVVTLKAPGVPQAEIIPVYINTGALTRIVAKIKQETVFNFTDDISGSVVNYTFSYSLGPSSTNTSDFASCGDGDCVYDIDIPKSLCSQSLNISVSAVNAVVRGAESQPFSIECTNQFVDVDYDVDASTISCVFVDNTHRSESTNYTCSVRYGQCGMEMNQATQENTTTDSSNRILLKLVTTLSGCYMYVVTASNATHRVMVEGEFHTATVRGGGSNVATVVIVALIVVVLVAIAAAAVITIIIYMYRQRKTTDSETLDGDVNNSHSQRKTVESLDDENQGKALNDENDGQGQRELEQPLVEILD